MYYFILYFPPCVLSFLCSDLVVNTCKVIGYKPLVSQRDYLNLDQVGECGTGIFSNG